MFGGKRYNVQVTTGKAKGAGTNATVKIVLIDHEGKKSEEKVLDKWLHNDFEYGKVDTYAMTTPKEFGRVEHIILHRDEYGVNDSWFLEHITITHDGDEPKVHFPLSRWIPSNKPMKFLKYDSQLPQDAIANDPQLYKDQRQVELENKRGKDAFQCAPLLNMTGMPRTVINLPPEEVFHRDYLMELGFTKITGAASDHLKKLRHEDDFASFNDIYKLYSGPLSPFPIPNGHSGWRTDEKFARLRLTGPNCTVIRGVKKDGMPPSFPVDKKALEEHFLQEQTFETCLEKDRLFYINYKDLDGYTTKEGNMPMVAPIALFYARFDGVLIPLAIQLYQTASPTNPIFYPPPIDEERVWLKAKFWFGVADSNYHEPVTHLLQTHLVAGDFVTCFHHYISPSHPLYKLMLPHFIYLLSINTDGMPVLIAENGAFNKILIFGLENCYDLMIKKYSQFKLKDHYLPTEITNRGVDNLPNYHYKVDAEPFFAAIEQYIKDSISVIYVNDEAVQKDNELQDFAKMLCDPAQGMKGVWGNGSFTNMDDLTKTMATMVFILTNVHAAANFNQYEEYGFPPNYPFRLNGTPPTTKKSVTEEELVKLFDVNVTLDTMDLGRTLSLQGTNKIGHYETHMEFKKPVLKPYLEFINNLNKIEEENDKKNMRRRNPYIWLSPKVVPNSISI